MTDINFENEPTVNDLIEALGKLPQDAIVRVFGEPMRKQESIASIATFEQGTEVIIYAQD